MLRRVTIDLAAVRSMDAFHDVVAKSLEFPSYYGRNPNAFWDCLTDITDDMLVCLSGYPLLEEGIKKEVDQYLDMLREYRDNTGGKFDVAFNDIEDMDDL